MQGEHEGKNKKERVHRNGVVPGTSIRTSEQSSIFKKIPISWAASERRGAEESEVQLRRSWRCTVHGKTSSPREQFFQTLVIKTSEKLRRNGPRSPVNEPHDANAAKH